MRVEGIIGGKNYIYSFIATMQNAAAATGYHRGSLPVKELVSNVVNGLKLSMKSSTFTLCVRFGRAKEVIVVHDCSIIWPCPVSTPTSIEDLDLPNPSVVKNENEEIGKKGYHTTARRGKKFLNLPPPIRPFHTLLSPASHTSGRSNAPGSSSKLSNLMHEVDRAWPSREAAVDFVHRARRAAK